MIQATSRRALRAALPLLLALGGCGDSAYKLINLPHCKADGGAASSGFAEPMLWIYKSGGSSGTGPLFGIGPYLGLGTDDTAGRELLLAVVACPAWPRSDISAHSNPAVGLTSDQVPELCPGQTVLFHGTLTASADAAAREKGYDGVLKFPDIAATCPGGTLARTTSADIEPRLK